VNQKIADPTFQERLAVEVETDMWENLGAKMLLDATAVERSKDASVGVRELEWHVLATGGGTDFGEALAPSVASAEAPIGAEGRGDIVASPAAAGRLWTTLGALGFALVSLLVLPSSRQKSEWLRQALPAPPQLVGLASSTRARHTQNTNAPQIPQHGRRISCPATGCATSNTAEKVTPSKHILCSAQHVLCSAEHDGGDGFNVSEIVRERHK